jgi:ATP-dependent helicase/nuclease subunit B
MTSPFEYPAPRWFSIPAHRSFLDDLAAGLVAALPEPERLAEAVVLVPTRRGARFLAEAFVGAAGGKATLLPQIRAIGDLDEGEPPFEPGDLSLDIPPAVDPRTRRFELARMVGAGDAVGRDLDAAGALEMADALAQFLDAVQIEEVRDPLGRLEGLVDLDMAEHWRRSTRVLKIALEDWPRWLAERDLIDVAERRVRLLDALTEQWTDHAPHHPLIAAGSTGAAPATARLLTAIARADNGLVVLPGLDEGLADTAWAKVEDQHPQGAMKRLLRDFAKIDRSRVRPWLPEADSRGRWRRRLINEALRPAEATADWRSVLTGLARDGEAAGVDPLAEGFAGLSVVAARHEEEAADVCALLLRETLETPDLTCALVTPDLALARRVSARLARFGVVADSSAGAPLSGFPAAVLARLVVDQCADPLSPVLLLAILKHPMTRLDREPEALAALVAKLENPGLRGARPANRDALLARVKDGDARALADDLFSALDVLAHGFLDGPTNVDDAARGLTLALEALAGQDIWSGPAGEALATLLAGLIQDGEALPPVSPRQFVDLLAMLLDGESLRTGAVHPRLRILGALEARLLRADRLVLAGLEDGVWPRGAPIDPFLSRPMRERMDLPSPERRLGLTAHDFAQAACAPEVVMVHSHRREGAPAVESRWLWRLRTLARGAGVTLPGRPELLDWARALDAPGAYSPVGRPAPRPPVADRPSQFAVTRIEALTRDPYSVWARDILKLFPMDRPDEPVEAKARGTAIHAAFEAFAERWQGGEPEDAAGVFEQLYVEALVAQGLPRADLARERALAREAAQWAADLERRRRADGRAIHVEQSGRLPLKVDGREFLLTAKADRIEITPDGLGHVLDFKTGGAPSLKQIDTGFSPQLTLTLTILLSGGFEGLKAYAGDLAYLRVTGRRPAGEEIVRKSAGPESEAAAANAYEGVMKLLSLYQDPARGYLSRTAPQFVKTYAGDYDHLARVFEWSTGGDGDGGGE